MLKHIIHDWADEHARNILKRVREGAWAGGKVNSTAAKGPLTTRKRKVSQNMGEGGESEDVEYEEIASNGLSSGQETEWPATKLVVLDMLAPYACRPGVLSSNGVNPNENGAIDMTFSTTGSFQVPAPEPLLPNYGGAWSPTYNADLAVSLCLFLCAIGRAISLFPSIRSTTCTDIVLSIDAYTCEWARANIRAYAHSFCECRMEVDARAPEPGTRFSPGAVGSRGSVSRAR